MSFFDRSYAFVSIVATTLIDLNIQKAACEEGGFCFYGAFGQKRSLYEKERFASRVKKYMSIFNANSLREVGYIRQEQRHASE